MEMVSSWTPPHDATAHESPRLFYIEVLSDFPSFLRGTADGVCCVYE
jgi:hypothetical protein